MTLMVRVPLAMFGQAMFFDTSPFGCFSIDECGRMPWHWAIGCYCTFNVRCVRVGCLIFTLLVSVLGSIDRDCEGVHEGSTSVESGTGDMRRGVRLGKYDQLGMTSVGAR